MRTVLVALSSILTICSTIPYVIEIIKGKVKPRVVSWFTWSLLTGIAGAASLSDKQYPAAILMFFATTETAVIVLLGLRFGERKFTRLDTFCQSGAILGLALWLLFNTPAVAVVATVAIDLIGAVPTIKHSWERPFEEAALTFFLGMAGALCTVLSAGNWKITAVAYPVYIVFINILLTLIILGRGKYGNRGEPAELREL